MPARKLSAFLVATSCVLASSWPSYRFRFPNGDDVPCPEDVSGCSDDGKCIGVGHMSCAGVVPSWNPFGIAMLQAKLDWKAVCNLDSDGDGVPNGVELGDPCCKWDYDDPATYDSIDTSLALSHPGFASSKIDASSVEAALASCRAGGTSAAANAAPAAGAHEAHPKRATERLGPDTHIDYDPSFFLEGEPQHVAEFKIDSVLIDNKHTVYEWFNWNWDGCHNRECYMVGIEMVIDNKELSHHWVINTCTQEPPNESDESDGRVGRSQRGSRCNTMIGGWAPGRDIVFRSSPDTSKLMHTDLRGFNANVHYDNPALKEGRTDSSSFRLYYTTRRRTHVLGELSPLIVSVDPAIRLPPGKKRVYLTSGCTLSGLREPIHIEQLWNHAHLLGREFYWEVYHHADGAPSAGGAAAADRFAKANTERYMMWEDTRWSFDDQYNKRLAPSQRPLRNGDFLQVMCVYDTTARANTTIFGPETNDEMCWFQMEYYPLQPNVSCLGPMWTGELEPDQKLEDIRAQLHMPQEALPPLSPTSLGVRLTTEVCLHDEMNRMDFKSKALMPAILMQCGGDFMQSDCLRLIGSVISCSCHCNVGYDKLSAETSQALTEQLPALMEMMGGMLRGGQPECPEVCPTRTQAPLHAPSSPSSWRYSSDGVTGLVDDAQQPAARAPLNTMSSGGRLPQISLGMLFVLVAVAVRSL